MKGLVLDGRMALAFWLITQVWRSMDDKPFAVAQSWWHRCVCKEVADGHPVSDLENELSCLFLYLRLHFRDATFYHFQHVNCFPLWKEQVSLLNLVHHCYQWTLSDLVHAVAQHFLVHTLHSKSIFKNMVMLFDASAFFLTISSHRGPSSQLLAYFNQL